MKLLLDTHALIWLIADDARIGKQAREVIVDPHNDVFVSIVSFLLGNRRENVHR